VIRLKRILLSGNRRILFLDAAIGLSALLAGLLFLCPPLAGAAEAQEEFNLEKGRIKEENILNLIFGSAPAMPTQRGILIIDAFHDSNGNGRREEGEEDLRQEIFCLVDDIEYDVPAFIPGLDLDGSYRVLCAGDDFQPNVSEKNVFVRRRGEIIRLDLPCSSLPHSTGSSHQPSTSGK
jgi:hypothetical protein